MIVLHTLGALRIDVDDACVTPVHSRKFAILLRLAARPGERVRRAELGAMLYPTQSALRAAHSVRGYLYQLRQLGVRFESDDEGLFIPAAGVRADYADVIAADRVTAEQISGMVGGFLRGYELDDSAMFGEWLTEFRAQTVLAMCRALTRQIQRFRTVADWEMMELVARACLGLEPLHDEATFALAETVAVSGAKMQAVALLDEFVRTIGDTARDLRLPTALLKRRISERLPASPRRSTTMPFVGREREMLALRDGFLASMAGESRCVVLSGDPGIGKSRVCLEFSRLAVLDGASVQRAAAQPYDVHRPMAAIADLVPGLLELPGALGCAPESMVALRRLIRADEPPSDVQPGDAQESEALYFAITRAFADLIDAVSAERPLVLIVEDIHWLDDVSIRLLARIAAGSEPRRVLVVLTTRERRVLQQFPAHADRVAEVELAPLDSAAVDRLIDAAPDLGETARDDVVRRWLTTTSSGNPLFLESLVAHYAETGQRFGISSTLRSLLQQRVARISTDAALTLQMCVLFGKHATLDLIEGAVHFPRHQLLGALSELDRARLIELSGDRMRPMHALIADAAVQRFSPLENRVAHRYVAEALELEASSSGSPGVIWDCAEHWVLAAEHERAVTALRRCAALSMDVGRPRTAAEALLRASELSVSTELQQELLRQGVSAADMGAEPSLVFRGLRRLQERAIEPAHDEFEFVEFAAAMRLQRDSRRYVDRLLACVSSTQASPTHRIVAATLILKHADVLGDPSAADQALARLPAESLAGCDELTGLEFQLILAAMKARHEDVLRIGPVLAGRAAELPAVQRARIQFNCAVAMWRAGDLEQGMELARAAHRSATEVDAQRLKLTIAVLLADFNLDLWNDAEAMSWLSSAESIAAQFPELREEISLAVGSVDIRIARGELAQAQQLFDESSARLIFTGSVPKDRWGSVFRVALSSASVTKKQIESLLRPEERLGPMSGLRDFEVAVACRALMAGGRQQEASEAISSYLDSERVFRSPHGRALESVCRELSVSPDPGAIDRVPTLQSRAPDAHERLGSAAL